MGRDHHARPPDPDRHLRPTATGGWEACDTISVFAFTGALPAHVLYETAERMLRDLHSVGARTYTPNTSTPPGIAAVRSSGYITVGGAQCGTVRDRRRGFLRLASRWFSTANSWTRRSSFTWVRTSGR